MTTSDSRFVTPTKQKVSPLHLTYFSRRHMEVGRADENLCGNHSMLLLHGNIGNRWGHWEFSMNSSSDMWAGGNNKSSEHLAGIPLKGQPRRDLKTNLLSFSQYRDLLEASKFGHVGIVIRGFLILLPVPKDEQTWLETSQSRRPSTLSKWVRCCLKSFKACCTSQE